MPSIIAICPYCRAGGVRAPDTAVGASATCPKCRSSFTVIPADDVPAGWDKPAPRPAPSPAPPDSSPLAETRAAAAVPDVTEPSPVLPAEERPKLKKNKPQEEPAPVSEPAEPPADFGLLLALGAVILVGPAVLASQLPFGRFVALGLGLIGLVGGLLSLGGEGRAKVYGGGGAGLHLLLLLVVAFLPSWLNLPPWRAGAEPEAATGPVMVEHGTGVKTGLPPGASLDAAKYSWQHQDVRVTVKGVQVGPVEVFNAKGDKRTTKEHYLQLVLQVTNAGYEREVALPPWAGGGTDGLAVADANGKPLAPATFDQGWVPAAARTLARVAPGHSAEAYFVYAAPPAKSGFVQVRLSASAFGAADDIRFRAGFAAPAGRPPAK